MLFCVLVQWNMVGKCLRIVGGIVGGSEHLFPLKLTSQITGFIKSTCIYNLWYVQVEKAPRKP